jgi:hypothetical protein
MTSEGSEKAKQAVGVVSELIMSGLAVIQADRQDLTGQKREKMNEPSSRQ